MGITQEIIKACKFFPSVYIETGCAGGDSIQTAIESKAWDWIVGIEYDVDVFRQCNERFADYPKVVLLNGDSAELLRTAMRFLHGKKKFVFLDAHKDDPANEGSYPLINEIATIVDPGFEWNIDLLVIDDVRLFSTYGMSLEEAKEKLSSKFSWFELMDSRSHEKDVLVCFR